MLIPDSNITNLIMLWNNSQRIQISYDNQLRNDKTTYQVPLSNVINNVNYDNIPAINQTLSFLNEIVVDKKPRNILINANVSNEGLSHFGKVVSYVITVKLIQPLTRPIHKKRKKPSSIIQVLNKQHSIIRRIK